MSFWSIVHIYADSPDRKCLFLMQLADSRTETEYPDFALQSVKARIHYVSGIRSQFIYSKKKARSLPNAISHPLLRRHPLQKFSSALCNES